MEIKAWQTYSLDGGSYTWGYTILYPIKNTSLNMSYRLRFYGWILYTNDEGRIVDLSNLQRHVIELIDIDNEDIEFDEIRKNVAETTQDWVKYKMIEQIFIGL